MEEKKRLFEEFPPVTTEEWEAVIEKDLKGADYNKKLVWRTAEGFNVKPYYRAENLADIPWTGQNPNEFPYVRGNKAEGNEWLVRQDITVKDVHEANKIALNAISRGANSIGFKLEYDKPYDTIAISTLLNGIDQKAVEINFYNNKYHLPILEMLSKIPDIKGSLNYDPLTRYLRRGTWFVTESTDMELGYIMVKADMPGFHTIGVNGHVFTNAGATIVQEMAFSLAVGAEYLDKLTEKGLTIDEIAPKMRFNLAIGQNYFMELAKLRAYRLLWANIVKAYGGKEENAINLPSSTFCFANQVPTLLDEELALLRGRSASTAYPRMTEAPCYNRLAWNFTKDLVEGEPAYVANYGIRARDGVLDVIRHLRLLPAPEESALRLDRRDGRDAHGPEAHECRLPGRGEVRRRRLQARPRRT